MKEAIVFTPADFKRLFFRYRRVIFKGSLGAGLLVFLFLLLKEPTYLAEATFKQGAGKVEQNFDLKSLLRMTASDTESSATSLMLSKNLLRRTVQELGWQAQVPLASFPTRIFDNFRAEMGSELPSRPRFVFEKVHYDGEKTKTLSLHFINPTTFEVLTPDLKLIALAQVGDTVSFDHLSFVLRAAPENCQIGKMYSMYLQPWQPVVAAAKQRFSIKPSPLDKSVLTLKFPHRSRLEGARFLNTLMGIYQDFLKEENQTITDAQLKYLERRQDELNNKLDRTLEEHVSHLQKNLGDKGFVDLEQEVESVSKPREGYLQKLFDVEFELGRLKNVADKAPADNEEFRSIDSQTARNLYLQYTRDLDTLQATLKQLLFLQGQMSDPHLDISSLGSILTDPVTQEMIRSASTLELELHDEANRSDKEHQRLRETLATKRRFIASHLSQSIELHHIRVSLLKEKLSSLEHVMVELLRNEKTLIEERLVEVGNRMSDWPEKWSLDKKFKLRTELTKGMMEGLTQIFESKTLNRHLFHVESRPLDTASPPLTPQSPHLLRLVLSAMCASSLLIYLYFFSRALQRGSPLSIQTIHALGEHVSGEISSSIKGPFDHLKSSDLETLRKAASFLLNKQEKLVVGLLDPQIDFSPSLAHLLQMHHKKTLIIDTQLDKVALIEDVPGLWHYLTSSIDTLPIRYHGAYDYVPAGGTTRFANELLTDGKFTTLLSSLDYDFIILIGSPSLLPFLDAAIVTLDMDNSSEWEKIRSWSRQKNSPRVTFVQLQISEVT